MNTRTSLGLIAAAALVSLAAQSTHAALSATADIALTSSTAGNNDYTVTVHNNGTTDIGTFWFAWTPPGDPIEYDFLPTPPSAATQPTGWVGLISSGFPGTSLEYYNLSGSPIAPGDSATFGFTTTDSQATLEGTKFGFPITTSFIYEGFPLTGAFAQVNPTFVAVPEPASMSLLGIAGLALLKRRRA
ncbi:MAG: PEP-CTERM sorting domain-containing protein [Phycisphaerae bacterium]